METSSSKENRVLTLLWRIKNIRVLESVDYRCSVISPVFRTRSLEGKRLRLSLRPKQVRGEGELVCLGLHLLDFPLDFLIDCEWSFIGSNKSPLFSRTEQELFMRTLSLYLPGSQTREEMFVTKRSEFLLHGNLTVRCRIWKSHGNLSNNEFISGQSGFLEVHDSFLWDVPGFNSLKLNCEVTIPVKFEFSNELSCFKLKFSLKGPSLEDSFANVELAAIWIPTFLRVSTKVYVWGLEEKATTRECTFYMNCKETCTLSEFVSREELLKNKSHCLRNNVLTLRCELIAINLSAISSIHKKDHGYINPEVDISKDALTFLDVSCPTMANPVVTAKVSPHREDPLAHWGEELPSLHQDQRPTDYELRAGDVSFPVHKDISGAWSPVFEAMLSSEPKESSSKDIPDQRPTDYELRAGDVSFPVHKDISNARSPVFEAMLSSEPTESSSKDIPDLDEYTLNRLQTYLQGGAVQLHNEGAAKLYYAADKYQIKSLKQQCSFTLRSNISVSNVTDILRLAVRHQDQDLTVSAFKFVLLNYDEVMQSEEWEKFLITDSFIAAKLVHRLYKTKLRLQRR